MTRFATTATYRDGFSIWTTKGIPITQVKDLEKCDGCPFQRLFPDNNFVSPFLVEGTRLAVAEAPGENEALLGEPLVGASGGWLFGKEIEPGKRSGGLYRAAGVDPNTVSKCNVINCRPPENVFPTDAEARSYISKEDAELTVKHCLGAYVEPLLKSRNWSRIDILGDKALRALTGLEGGITRWRGSPVVVPATGKTTPIAVATLHPAFLARSQELMPAVVNDLKKTTAVPKEHYNLTPSLEDVRAFQYREFAFDIECLRETGEITMVGLCGKPWEGMVVPAKGAYLTELKRIFENAEILYTQNGIAFDIPRLFPVLGLEWRPD
jgi:uracil-DNA glycosylase family 4